MSQKPSIPKGTRDFLPGALQKRKYIFSVIADAFQRYGFQGIETPSFEHTATLLGKYGEEGDRLIFRILNSGEKVKKADLSALQNDNLAAFAHSLSEKALRYDLTVPFARFVVQHQNELSFPFKRYQMQPVWRADRPQHGRYQEFYQCDGDVVGSDSLRNEVELMHVVDEVLSELSLPGFTIKVNNRKILSGIAEVCGVGEKLIDLTTALDKLDKIGEQGVLQELRDRSFGEKVIEHISPLFSLNPSFEEGLSFLEVFLASSVIGMKGVEELRYMYDRLTIQPLTKGAVALDVTLARGLNYYTGAIFEVKAHNVQMGSICGGGRYDDLTGLFGLKNLSGVGISFGADRIYDVMETLGLFPENLGSGPDYLFLNFSEEEADQCARWAQTLRGKGKIVELYPSPAKLQKQLKYANDKGVKQVVLYGENERKQGILIVKDMVTGEQHQWEVSSWLASIA
ncbi:MAG: histidine--tRNA ligase [Flavobacteriales bacterium]